MNLQKLQASYRCPQTGGHQGETLSFLQTDSTFQLLSVNLLQHNYKYSKVKPMIACHSSRAHGCFLPKYITQKFMVKLPNIP